jgi:hypothetical protein
MKIKIIVFIFVVCTFITAIISCNNHPNRAYFTINPENRLIVIPVQIADSIIANMVFDTGWGVFTLDSSYYSTHPYIQWNEPDSFIKIGSSWSFSEVAGSFYKTFQTIKIGQVSLTYQNRQIFNYKDYYNTQADGILGIPYNDSTHVWELNFDHNYLEIHQAEGFEMPNNCYLLALNEHYEIEFPLRIEFSDGDTMTVHGKYFVDTGMPQDIVLVHPNKEELEFFNKRNEDVILINTGSGVLFRYTVSSTLFENYVVDSLRIYTLDNPRRLKGDRIVGQNFLKRFNVFFDLKNRQLGLQPINNFQRIVDPTARRFHYSITRTQEGKYILTKVINSPSNYYYTAGLREGDEIYTLNDKIYMNLSSADIIEIDNADTIRWVFLRGEEEIIVIHPNDRDYNYVD